MSTREPAPLPGGWTNTRISTCLIAVTLLTYLPVLRCEFVEWDDPLSVTRNPAVTAGLVPRSIVYAFTTFDTGNWIPLTWLSLELDASLFGQNAAGFHATNVVLHACNVWLLFLVLDRLTGSPGRSAIVALFYGIHPLHVESVAWVSERKDVLSTFWLLATLLMYERYARRPSVHRLVATGLLMTLGLSAKQMLVTLPILLLLLDLWPMRRIAWSGHAPPIESVSRYSPVPWWKAVLEKLPLFVLSMLAGAITLVAQRTNMPKESTIPALYRLTNAIHAYGWYLWKTIYPVGLSAFYPHPLETLSWQTVGCVGGALVILTILSLYYAKKHPYIPVGWLWFVATLLPVIGLVQVGKQAYADRYAYVPHVGLFVSIIWGASDLLSRFKAGLKVGISVAAVGAMVCIWLTILQIGTWQSTRTLWSHALSIDPTNYLALSAIGVIDFKEQKFETAQRDFMEAAVSNPHDGISIYWLGRLCCERQEWNQAAQYFSWVLRLDPQNEDARRNLEVISARITPQPATEARSSPVDPAATDKVRIGLKLARKQFARRADFESALRYFEEAAKIDPKYAGAIVNAANACRELNRRDEAIRHLRHVITLEPDRQEHHTDIAQLLELNGQLQEAKSHYEAALDLKLTDVETQILLKRLQKRLHPQ